MASIPFVATSTGDAEDAPAGAIPIALFGASSGATEVTIADVAGLQAIIDDLTGRIEALEPAG